MLQRLYSVLIGVDRVFPLSVKQGTRTRRDHSDGDLEP